MSRSIQLRPDRIERVKLALKRSGFLSQRNLAESAGYSLATIGKFLRGKPVDVATFVELCSCLNLDCQEEADLQRDADDTPDPTIPSTPLTASTSPPAVVPTASTPTPVNFPDWGDAPSPGNFFGREAELQQLLEWLEGDRPPVLLLLGMGGIGKTTLAAQFARHVQNRFARVIWRSLRNAPSLTDLLGSLLPYLSDRTQVPNSLDERLSLLGQVLQEQPCLVVLDNSESLLQAAAQGGGYRPGCETYAQLFRLLAGLNGPSCLLLTSREKPSEFTAIAAVRTLTLRGLSETAGWDLLQTQPQFADAAIEGGHRLVARYGGNPLALKLIAATIQDFIAGNLAEFLNVLADEPALLDDIRHLIAEQIDRLAPREREISYWLAIACDPVSWRTLQTDVAGHLATGEILSGLANLDRRSLLEKHGETCSQPPSVQEYLLDDLIVRVCQEIISGSIDWFGRYALLQAQAREYARAAQRQLILQPIADRLLAELGERKAIAGKLQYLLDAGRAQGRDRLSNSYLASNCLHLLHHLGIPLRGWDFSGLPVRQANLQGLDLQDVSFAGCQFARTTFTQPFGSIRAIAFAPPGGPLGQVLATGDTSGEVRLWGLAECQTLFSHRQHENWVCALAFSPDGKHLVSGCADGKLIVWLAETDAIAFILPAHDNWILDLAFSPDGKQFVSASGDHTLKLWDATSGQCLRTFAGHERGLWSVAFSPDGQTLASASTDGTIKIWDAIGGDCLQTLPAHAGGAWSVAFSPDGQSLASGGADNAVKLWSVASGECLQTLREHGSWVWEVAFSLQGNLLASGSADGTVKLWDTSAGECQKTLQGHSNWVWCVAFNPYSDTLASGSEDRTLRLWDIHTGRCWQALEGQGNWVWSVTFSPDGQTLASGSEDRTIRLWHAHSGDCHTVLRGTDGAIWSVAFHPDGGSIVSGTEAGSICLWPHYPTVKTDRPTRRCTGHGNTVWSVAFSPDGQTLASASADCTIKVWDVKTGRCDRTLVGHDLWVMAVAFSPDGQTLASASADRTVKLWD
ncbi:MAG: NB-ARC domain-containing protein, partial [Cyanobacteria bacterium J06641_5]